MYLSGLLRGLNASLGTACPGAATSDPDLHILTRKRSHKETPTCSGKSGFWLHYDSLNLSPSSRKGPVRHSLWNIGILPQQELLV